MISEYSGTVPKIGDRVGVVDRSGLFEVVDVKMRMQTVNLKTTDGQSLVAMNVPWTSLTFHSAASG